MSVAKSQVPPKAPPAGSVASGRTHRTAKTQGRDDEPDYERPKSIATRAPTVVPSDSISQAGDRSEAVPSNNRSTRASQAGGSQAGSQRLTAEALEALSERNSDVRSRATVTRQVEVIEEAPPTKQSAHSRAASKSLLSKAALSTGSRATARPATVAASKTHHSASIKTSSSKPASSAAVSKSGSVAPSHRSSRHTATNIVEVTESAAPAKSATSIARSHYSEKASGADKSEADRSVPPRSSAPSHARSRATSRATSKCPEDSPSHPPAAQVAVSVASHSPSHRSTAKPAKSVASHAPSHATSHHSAVTAAKSGTSHPMSRHSSSHEHSTPPTSPSSPTAPEPPPASEEKTASAHSGSRDLNNMHLVQRSSFDVVAPRSTAVDVVQLRRRDGKLVEKEYAIAPSITRYWQPSVSLGVADDGTVYRKQYRYRRPRRVAYMRRVSSYDGY